MSEEKTTAIQAAKESSEQLLKKLQDKLGAMITETSVSLGDAVVKIEREHMLEFFRLLKLDSELSFDMLASVTAVDWLDEKDSRFEVVYHFLSIPLMQRIRVKIDVSEEDPKVDSVVELWSGANFMEREVYDMYGINFEGHPDQRRILMYDEFVGHPLRKDYPVQGKQPRVKLLHPEVENTAQHMKRSELVQIGGGRSGGGQIGRAS